MAQQIPRTRTRSIDEKTIDEPPAGKPKVEEDNGLVKPPTGFEGDFPDGGLRAWLVVGGVSPMFSKLIARLIGLSTYECLDDVHYLFDVSSGCDSFQCFMMDSPGFLRLQIRICQRVGGEFICFE